MKKLSELSAAQLITVIKRMGRVGYSLSLLKIPCILSVSCLLVHSGPTSLGLVISFSDEWENSIFYCCRCLLQSINA